MCDVCTHEEDPDLDSTQAALQHAEPVRSNYVRRASPAVAVGCLEYWCFREDFSDDDVATDPNRAFPNIGVDP